jgi:hypothetical protein
MEAGRGYWSVKWPTCACRVRVLNDSHARMLNDVPGNERLAAYPFTSPDTALRYMALRYMYVTRGAG